MDGDFIAQATALVVLLGGIFTLFLKIRGVEKDMEETIEKKIEEKVKEQDKLQIEKDKLAKNKYETIWHKVNGLDTQVNGNPDTEAKGLAMTVAMLKLIIKDKRKNDED